MRSFLASRDTALAEGSADSPSGADTIRGLGNRKKEIVLKLIREQGVQPYEGSVRYVNAARAAGLRRAVASSSSNCRDARIGQADALRAHGADVVVGDLADLLDAP